MEKYSLANRILGALIGAAAGDGMGAATEARTTQTDHRLFRAPGHRF